MLKCPAFFLSLCAASEPFVLVLLLQDDLTPSQEFSVLVSSFGTLDSN